MTALPPTNDDRLIWDTWLSLYRLPVVTVADQIGTFAAIADRALTTDELAAALGCDSRALGIHLGLLAATGFVERREERWRASAQARTWLIPGTEAYVGPALHHLRDVHPVHAQLLETLGLGKAGEEHVSAAAEWERGEMPPEMAATITAYMNAHSQASSRGVAAQPAFADVCRLLDVGGGSGIFSIQLAKGWPELAATVMDIAAVCAEAAGYIADAGIGGQVSTLPVNMFTQDWPGGYDAHFLSNIFHDWSADTNRLLAAKSFAALPSGGRIMLHEMLMDDDGCGPLPAAAFSLLMLLGTRGKQYSLPELREILASAGFVDVTAATTGGGYYALVTARKP